MSRDAQTPPRSFICRDCERSTSGYCGLHAFSQLVIEQSAPAEPSYLPQLAPVLYVSEHLKIVDALQTAHRGEVKATWLKLRTWAAIQDRARAGEAVESLATDFRVPVDWIRFVLFPENAVDDNALRARAEAAEQQHATLQHHHDALLISYRAAEQRILELIAVKNADAQIALKIAEQRDALVTALQAASDWGFGHDGSCALFEEPAEGAQRAPCDCGLQDVLTQVEGALRPAEEPQT